MSRPTHFAIEVPRGHYLPVVGPRRRDCALSLACEMAHAVDHAAGTPASCPVNCGWAAPMERLDVGEYLYVRGAGPLAHVEQPRRLRPEHGRGLPTGLVPRQPRGAR